MQLAAVPRVKQPFSELEEAGYDHVTLKTDWLRQRVCIGFGALQAQ